LLILINPLIEVGLQEVDLLCFLQQAWPELLLHLLLAQDELDVLGGVVDLSLGGVDLGEEVEHDVVVALEGIGVTGEGQRIRLDIDLRSLDIWDGDGHIEVVLCSLSWVGTLSPEDWKQLANGHFQEDKRDAAELVCCCTGEIEPLPCDNVSFVGGCRAAGRAASGLGALRRGDR